MSKQPNRRTMLAVMAAALIMMGTGCTGGDSGTRPESIVDQLPLDRVSARLVGEFPLIPAALSADGSQLFGWVSDQAGLTVCLAQVASSDRSGDVCSTGTSDDGHLSPGFPPAWSPDGDRLAWTSLGDIWTYEVAGGTLEGITDDGVDDTQEPDGSQIPVDFWPTWSDTAELTFIRSDPGQTSNRLTTTDLSGTVNRTVTAPTPPDWAMRFGPPLVVDGNAYLGAADVIHEVDIASGDIEVFANFAEQYDERAAEFEQLVGISLPRDGSNLLPAGFARSGGLLLWDSAVFEILNQTGGASGPSGAFILERSNEQTALFESSNEDRGYLSPMAVAVSPGGTKLLFVWIDAATQESDAGVQLNSHVSMLDLETTALPADPRTLPELWSAPADVLLGFAALEWTDSDRIAIQGFGLTSAVTYVLQLEESQS